jgi:hypothetical protein
MGQYVEQFDFDSRLFVTGGGVKWISGKFVVVNTVRTGAFKLFKCAFPGSKQLNLYSSCVLPSRTAFNLYRKKVTFAVTQVKV